MRFPLILTALAIGALAAALIFDEPMLALAGVMCSLGAMLIVAVDALNR